MFHPPPPACLKPLPPLQLVAATIWWRTTAASLPRRPTAGAQACSLPPPVTCDQSEHRP
jgi:hypothetical protein